MKQGFFSFIFLMLLAGTVFAATIGVTPLIINLNNKQLAANIRVANTGNSVAYVSVQVLKVQNPGMANERVIALVDKPETVGLITVPDKLIIPVKQLRVVRVYLLHPNKGKVDEVYHVMIQPVEGQLVPTRSATGKDSQGGLKLIVAYEVKIFARPQHAKPNIELVRNGKHLTVTNKGNTNVYLSHAKQCINGTCHNLANIERRMFAGNLWHVNLPYNAPISFRQAYAGHMSIIKSS